MALNFIPTVWAARLLLALEKALVYAQPGIVNRDYEGEIKASGNTVKIGSIGDVTVGDYVKNTDIANPELLQDGEMSLLIDNSKYFNFYVDSIDRAQQNVNVMDTAMTRAAWSLREKADEVVAAVMALSVLAGNKIGTNASPIVPTKDTAYEYLVDLGVKLDESDTPSNERFVVVPSWFHGLLLKDERFVKSGTPTGDAVLRNGEVGEAAGFKILKSNNVPNTTGTKYNIIGGTAMSTTYAEQILDLQSYKPEKRFGDAVKGLHVYGAKVTRAKNLAMLIANKS
jgi:hypothetical protein